METITIASSAAALYTLGVVLVAFFVMHELSGQGRSWSDLPREDQCFSAFVGAVWPLAVIALLLMIAAGVWINRGLRVSGNARSPADRP